MIKTQAGGDCICYITACAIAASGGGNEGRRERIGGHPQPPAGRTLHPFVEMMGKGSWGHPQAGTPGGGIPAPLLVGKGRIGDTPKPPAGGSLHSFVEMMGRGSWGTPPKPRLGDPCTPRWVLD